MLHTNDYKEDYFKGGGIPCSHLYRWLLQFKDVATDDMEPHWQEITRAFLMWVIGQVLFPNSSSIVKVGWLASLEDLEKIGTYDWGGATLARVYQSLCETSSGRILSFDGMWMILPYWFYFYFRSLIPIFEERIPNSFGYEPIDLDRFPQIAVFNKDQLADVQVGTARHSRPEAQRQIDMRTIESTTW
ncbi:hypothetical protein C5167_035104 [Papaver somniferum]|uniref:Aminotransferase-like plant mobile domain-containing protein n=1 Tax=Papaver somniferum TaxID=3469 RepID=A0A4Y7KGH2_PAPSO|nr:protein MAIN-LIKE 2-like [Papaver somniferum]RZC71947.1 hypothetical protein C5167_035104 [Papaver somniferum]